MTTHNFRSVAHGLAATAPRIDASAGIIFGVSVITVGDAKGHGLKIDRTTLEQVKSCAERYKGGLKVKMTHAGDAGDFVGALRGFRIEGEQLRADLHLLRTAKQRDYVMEIAEKLPASFGLSIAFSGPTEDKNGLKLTRCMEIYSADLVAEPAANPGGLFASGPQPSDAGKTFEALVAKHTLTMGKPAAIRHCVKTYSAAHQDFLRRSYEAQSRGGIIRL